MWKREYDILATQLCPCGYYNHPDKDCVCAPAQIQRYLAKISGPLLDRIDLHVEVTPVPFDELASKSAGESSSNIRERVIAARQRQLQRFDEMPGIYSNAMMPSQMVRRMCAIDKESESLLEIAMTKLDLSARAFDRILKVARTIADLSDSDCIKSDHVAEAFAGETALHRKRTHPTCEQWPKTVADHADDEK